MITGNRLRKSEKKKRQNEHKRKSKGDGRMFNYLQLRPRIYNSKEDKY